MEKQKQIRGIFITVRLKEREYKQLNFFYEETTYNQFNDYPRRPALNKPVNLKYLNVSIDDFLANMPALKKIKCHPGMILTSPSMSRTRCNGCRNFGNE